MDSPTPEQLVEKLQLELRNERETLKRLMKEQEDQQSLARHLAMANAKSADLMAEIELRNAELQETNTALARANAHAAELMTTIVLKDEAIAESENRLRVTLSQLPAVIWTVSNNLTYTSVHGTLLIDKVSGKIFGRKPKDVVGSVVADDTGNDTVGLPMKKAHLRALDGCSSEFEFQIDDEVFYCHIEPLYTSSRLVRGAIGIAQDISNQRKAERDRVLAAEAADKSRIAEEHITELKAEIMARETAEDKQREALDRLKKTLEGTVYAMAQALEVRDAYTAGHQRRVAKLSKAIAEELKFDVETASQIYLTALIHDIGKLAIPAEILAKPGKLSDIEFQLVKTHSSVGFDMLKSLAYPWPIATIVKQHHERMDGSGYPDGLRGEAITIEARIISVADVVEAVASHRPYRPALGLDTAFRIILESRGKMFDPKVVDACLDLFQKKAFTLD